MFYYFTETTIADKSFVEDRDIDLLQPSQDNNNSPPFISDTGTFHIYLLYMVLLMLHLRNSPGGRLKYGE